MVQHHEGAGKPRNGVYLPHYCYIIGDTEWHMRSDLVAPNAPKPGGDTSVLDFNRIIVSACLTGNRNDYPVTDLDLEMMIEIGNDAKSRGWLVDFPNVMPHNQMPGNGGECPGTMVMARWPEIKYAYQKHPVPVPKQGGVVLTTVVSPQKGNPAGRVPTARPIPELGAIMLENGAALKGDTQSGGNRIWISNDPAVKATGNKLVDIAPTCTAGKPDGKGVVALFDLGNNVVGTYQLEWS